MSTMSHERSLLLAHPSRRNVPKRPARQESTTSANTNDKNRANLNGNGDPIDFLWGDNNGEEYTERKGGRHYLKDQHSRQNAASVEDEEDRIQIDDYDVALPVSTCVKQLQAREQVRQRVQANNVRNDHFHRQDILLDDYDDDEYQEGNVNSIRSLPHKPQEQLLELELIADVTSSTEPNSNINGDSFPLDDLTHYGKQVPYINRIMNSTRGNVTIPFLSGGNNDNDGPVGLQKNIRSPPRPLQQPVNDAKRAISTLFGSSVVVNLPTVVQGSSNGVLRKTSLLDAVSSLDDIDLENAHGLEMSPAMSHKMMHEKGDKKVNSQRETNPGANKLQSQKEVPWQNLNNNDVIDIGDPFDFKPLPIGVNYRSSNGPTTSRQSVNSNNRNLDASSMARKWFGKPHNYTTQPLHMPSKTTKDAIGGSERDHYWMDRLHKDAVEDSAHDKLSVTRILCGSSIIKNHLNLLNVALFVSYGLTSAASSVPITLIPTIAMDILSRGSENQEEGGRSYLDESPTVFASTVATYAVLGTALGKFLNGPIGDVFGARRVACLYALMLSLSLMILSFGSSGAGVISCCVAVEFFQSVQWPCIAVVLAAHYNNNSDLKGFTNDENGKSSPNPSSDISKSRDSGRYEKGIFISSLGSRCGSLLASLSTTLLLQLRQDSWRMVARLAAMSSFIGCLVLFMFVTDSPYKVHDPQNPIKETFRQRSQLASVHGSLGRRRALTISQVIDTVMFYLHMVIHVFMQNIVPSLRSVLSNGTFWFVALAHSGGVMVCTSVRILGTYFRDTSYGVVSEKEAGAVTMFLSIGILFGLAIGGNAFANLSSNAFARKKMISNLYILAVAMCYMLAFLAIPIVRKGLRSSTVVAFLQGASSFCMGASVAVQVYCIPAIVSCRFGANKGLYTSYTDGVASIVSSWVWRIVGGAVQEGNPQGAGWAYGWAAVALLVILAGVVMVQFMDYYFCRGGWRGEIRHAGVRATFDPEAITRASHPNSSLADTSKRIWANRPAIFRPNFTFNGGQEMPSILSMEDDDDASTIVFEDITLPFDYSDIQCDNANHEPAYLKSQVLDLLDLKGNDVCVDCQAP
jgi:Sugar phosphate permease